MPTDAGDVAGVAGSTMAGAAAGSIFGPWGTFIGGGIGFLTGLFGNSAENAAEDLAALQMQREKIAAGIMGEARETGLVLNALEVDRKRSQYAQKAFLGSEAITAAGAITGLMGSSIAKNARASMGQQRASGLQFSMLTEQLGNQISQLQQDAVNARLGILTPEQQAAANAAMAAAAAAAAAKNNVVATTSSSKPKVKKEAPTEYVLTPEQEQTASEFEDASANYTSPYTQNTDSSNSKKKKKKPAVAADNPAAVNPNSGFIYGAD